MIQVRVKVIKEVLDLFPECRPQVGAVYDAVYSPKVSRRQRAYSGKAEFCVINFRGKHIVLREGEYEIIQ